MFYLLIHYFYIIHLLSVTTLLLFKLLYSKSLKTAKSGKLLFICDGSNVEICLKNEKTVDCNDVTF